MIDFTNLFLVFLMILAMQANRPEVAAAVFVILLVLAKSKALILVAVVAAVIAIGMAMGEFNPFIVGGGLMLIMVILFKGESEQPQQGYYPGG